MRIACITRLSRKKEMECLLQGEVPRYSIKLQDSLPMGDCMRKGNILTNVPKHGQLIHCLTNSQCGSDDH